MGPCQERPGLGTQTQVPPAPMDIAVVSRAVLGKSRGGTLGTEKGRRLRAQRVPGCSDLCNYRFVSVHQPSSGLGASVKDVALQCDPGSPILPLILAVLWGLIFPSPLISEY